MSIALDTNKYTIGSLLGRYERRKVILPEFQRSYSWEKAQVSIFWDDIELFEKEYTRAQSTAAYYLGSIVVIQKDESILLLDGQQRLATATIALAALRDVARTIDKAGYTKGADLARDIQRELIEKDTDPVSYALTLSELDEPYFINAIKKDPPTVPQTKLRSHLLIQSAYKQSTERVNLLIRAKEYDLAIKTLKSFKDALSKGFTLIAISVLSEEDAYGIFETLNDRGLRLSVPDLVINLLMRRAPDDTARKLVRNYWNAMIRQLGRRDVSRFLRHLWVSRYGDLKTEGLFTAIKTKLETAKLDSVSFSELCSEECDNYVALLDANVPLSKEGQNNLEAIVKYLQITSAPPILLAGYKCLGQQEFEKLIKIVIAIYIRYIVVSNQNPLDVETRLYEAARLIRSLSESGESSPKQLHMAKSKIAELNIDDSSLLQSDTEIFFERPEAIWIMTQLANSMQTATNEICMDKANLEHIFPVNPTASGWPNMGSLESYTWHIGNLTILGERLNNRAQNKGFSEKATQFYNRSEIVMTKELTRFHQWEENEILGRGLELKKKIVELWKNIE